MPTIFCPHCHDLILDQPACPACGWQRPLAIGDAGTLLWQGELSHRLGRPRCYPVIAAGRYCVPTADGFVVALDLATGEKAWERALAVERTAHALATDGQRIFVGCIDMRPLPAPGAALLALDAGSGAVLWEYPTSGHSLSAAVAVENTVFFTSSDGLLHALDASTGQKRWIRKYSAWGPEAPAVGAGLVCVGGRGDTLIAYSTADGAERWHFAAGGWFAGEICVAGERVYTVCWDNYLYALNLRSGECLWKSKGERAKGFTGPPTVAGERLFIGDRVSYRADAQQLPTYAVLALDTHTGAELWRFRTGRHIFAPLTIAGDTLLFGADDGSFFALDAASGTERWASQVDGRVAAQPQVDGDLVYVAERNGSVYALRWRASPVETLSPETYLERGEHEQAAVAFALVGNFAAATEIYQQLDKPREAALLYERAGLPGQAAQLWRQLGDLRRARDRYIDADNSVGVAEMLVQLGEPLQAAQRYEEAGHLLLAAELYEQYGDRTKAADLYYQDGHIEQAQSIWRLLEQWERIVESLIAEGNVGEAASILEQQEQLERAANLYEQADELQQALRLHTKRMHWEHAAALAERLAQRDASATPVDEERVAALYERAAQLYSEFYDEERVLACRSQVRRYRHLPELTVAGLHHEVFVEFEWNILKLQVNNTGYGVARDVAVTLRGPFDINNDLKIEGLLAGRSRVLELSVRPHREQFGPKVPLEILIEYADAHGRQHRAVQRHPVPVVRQGIEHGYITGQQLPSQEEINRHFKLLETYRRNLSYQREVLQQALLGTKVPLSLIEDLLDAQKQIRSIKAILRGWGVPVEDSPDDEVSVVAIHRPKSNELSSAVPNKRALREAIMQAFSLAELDLLAADIEQDLETEGIKLQVSIELVGGSGKADKVLKLIKYLDRRGYLTYLVAVVRRSRPGII